MTCITAGWQRTLWSLWCWMAVLVTAQQDYYDPYPDYQDYAGEQGYDDHLYHDYAARQQEKDSQVAG